MKIEQLKALHYGEVLHHNRLHNADETCQRWRVNGTPKTWKRRPESVRVPIKRGLYEYGYVDECTMDCFHHSVDCPNLNLKVG